MKGVMKIFVVILFFLVLVGYAASSSAGWGNEAINYTPTSFRYQVNEKGEITGLDQKISITVSREESPKGVPQRCKQVGRVFAFRTKDATTASLDSTLYSHRIGELTLDPPKCSFDGTIIGEPFSKSDIRSACFMLVPSRQGIMTRIESKFRPGTSQNLRMSMYVVFVAAKAFGEALMLSSTAKWYEFRLSARVDCVASREVGGGGATTPVFRAEPVQPTATLAGSGGSGAGGGTSTGQPGGAMCDLSGNWRQRNTRSNEVSPLAWKIELLRNEGGQGTRNYEVTRYKDGRRFSPPASGRLHQSPQKALIFYDTPASMPRYNVSRIMSLRKLAVQPGCTTMKVLQVVDTWKGTRGVSSLVMERLQAGSLRPIGSAVGRPVVKGQQPVWQGDRRPVLPDNRRQEIERHERLRGR